jgi:Holliday junction resolvasome RuvABC ATP-dependent DNA helicase subunit
MLDTVLGINEDGLDEQDSTYLSFLAHYETLGIATLASFMRKDPRELTEKIEPFLLGRNFIKIEKSGRQLTPYGRAALQRHKNSFKSS